MQLMFLTKDKIESFKCDVANLSQLLNYCKCNKPELYVKLIKNEYSYTVYKEGATKAFPIRQEAVTTDLSNFDILVISEKLYGEAIISAIAGVIAGLMGAASLAAASAAVAFAAYAIAVIIVIGIVIGLGYLVQALTPNKKLTGEQDPSEASRLFNGVPNITEQGGSVPIVVGNCLFGGVRIGLKFEPASRAYTDVRTVTTFSEAMAYPSNWLKIT